MEIPTKTESQTQIEFADAKTVRQIFGISRSTAYQLNAEGKIRSVSLRRHGSIRGRRLFDCKSIRTYLNHCTGERVTDQEG